jgi:DnaJ-domain-containing protein 1
MRVWIDEAGRVRTRVVTNNEDKRTYLHPWEVFDLPEYAPIEAVKRAYREAMKQYHPDRVFDLGPELRKLAEEKTKQYNEAYAEIIDYFAA